MPDRLVKLIVGLGGLELRVGLGQEGLEVVALPLDLFQASFEGVDLFLRVR